MFKYIYLKILYVLKMWLTSSVKKLKRVKIGPRLILVVVYFARLGDFQGT